MKGIIKQETQFSTCEGCIFKDGSSCMAHDIQDKNEFFNCIDEDVIFVIGDVEQAKA